MRLHHDSGCAKTLPSGSWAQRSRELVFCSASGASNRVDNDALGRSHARSDHGTAVTALVIGVAAATEQRFNKLGRAVISRARWRTRDLQRDDRHRARYLITA